MEIEEHASERTDAAMVTQEEARLQLGLLAASPEEVMAAAEGELVESQGPLTRHEAEALVDEIRSHVGGIRAALLRMDEGRGWEVLGFKSWRQWVAAEFLGAERTAYQELRAGRIERAICAAAQIGTIPERHLRPLSKLKLEGDWRAVWRRVQIASVREPISGGMVERIVEEWIEEQNREELVLVEEPIRPKPNGTARLNRTNDSVDWAWWTWNPVTGCLHDCAYCYARDIANRFYPEGFKPTFRPERLGAPRNTPVPTGAEALANPQSGRIFTCSMADLFGKWVPQEWIDAVFAEVRDNPQWEFLFLTKFPQRLAEIEWPDNAWVGTTVDKQYRVSIAEKSFRGVKAGVKWLSCEPMLEPLKFSSLEMFDLVVIGGCSKSSQTPEFWPPLDWMIDLYNQARSAGCAVYFKENALDRITPRPKELPRGR